MKPISRPRNARAIMPQVSSQYSARILTSHTCVAGPLNLAWRRLSNSCSMANWTEANMIGKLKAFYTDPSLMNGRIIRMVHQLSTTDSFGCSTLKKYTLVHELSVSITFPYIREYSVRNIPLVVYFLYLLVFFTF